jgi:thioredoxin reductase (NADPH)
MEKQMAPPTRSIMETRRDQMFPVLDPEDIERVTRFGQVRAYQSGEAIVTVGRMAPGIIIVLSGKLDVTQHDQYGGRKLIVTLSRGEFMGELAQLAGRPALVDVYAQEQVEALIIPQDRLRALLIAEADLGERMMRAMILRRVGLLETGAGGPVIVGRAEDGNVSRLEGFLRRNGHPHMRLDPENDQEATALIERFNIGTGHLPIVLCPGGQLLRNPGEVELARCIGLVGPIDSLRCGGHRSWARGSRYGSLCRLRRPLGPGAGLPRVRRPGRGFGTHRELPRLPDRNFRHCLDGAGLPPGAKVWRRDGYPG